MNARGSIERTQGRGLGLPGGCQRSIRRQPSAGRPHLSPWQGETAEAKQLAEATATCTEQRAKPVAARTVGHLNHVTPGSRPRLSLGTPLVAAPLHSFTCTLVAEFH